MEFELVDVWGFTVLGATGLSRKWAARNIPKARRMNTTSQAQILSMFDMPRGLKSGSWGEGGAGNEGHSWVRGVGGRRGRGVKLGRGRSSG
jgi:hypothetical protein